MMFRLTSLIGAALLLASCGGGGRENAVDRPQDEAAAEAAYRVERIPRPSFFGLYALAGNGLARLDGEPSWEVATWPERSNLPTDTAFVIFDPSVASGSAPLRELVQLRHVARVRNAVVLSTATVRPLENDEWVAPDLPPFRVALDFRPVDGRSDMIVAVPRTRLEAGLYELRLNQQAANTTGRLGVNWSGVDPNRYAATYCVDRYQGADAPYGLCGLSAGR